MAELHFSVAMRRSRLPAAALIGALALLPLPATASGADPVDLDRLLVVSTGTRSERLLSDVPVRTEVLRGEDIALRATLDFSRAAELVTGLRVESNCQNCNTSEVQLLGLGGAYNQLLFDGVPLMSTLGSVYGLEQVPVAFINRMEVVKGGGSALYGPGAVAGVVNLIPDQPVRNGGFVQAMAESQKGELLRALDGRADLVSDDGRAGASLVAQWIDGDAVDFDGDGYTEIVAREQRVAGVQAWLAPGERTTLRANWTYTEEDRRGGNRLDQPEWLANVAESLSTRYHRGGLYWDQLVGDRADFTLGYSFASVRRDSFYGGLGEVATDPADPAFDPDELDPGMPGSAASRSWRQYGYTDNPLHYVEALYRLRHGSHAWTAGAQYRHERIRDDQRDAAGATVVRNGRETFTNLGLFVQDEWALADTLDLVFGARADRSSALDDPIVSPRLAIAWKAGPGVTWRAGLSTGFRAPEAFSEDLHVDTLGAEPVRIRNVDGLREERATTAMLGFDWRPATAAWSWDLTLSAARLRDTFVLGEIARDAAGLYQVRSNAEGSKVAGVESNIAWQPAPELRLTAGAAWYRSRHDAPQVVYDDTGEGGDMVLATREFLKTPRWSGQAQLVWSPSPLLDAYAAINWTGRMHALNNNTATLNRTPRFLVVDMGTSWHLGEGERHWDLGVGVRNLFDQRQKDLETGPGRDNDYVYGPRFARTFHVNLRWNF